VKNILLKQNLNSDYIYGS